MLRPIATNEIGWLARILVSFSRALNSYLGLDGIPLTPPQRGANAGAPAAAQQQYEPPETLLQEWLLVARRRGWRVNLRPLAEKQTLAWVCAVALVTHWILLWLLSPAAERPAGGSSGWGGWDASTAAYEQQQRRYEQQQRAAAAAAAASRQQQQHGAAASRQQQWEEDMGLGGPGDLGAW